MSEFRAAELIQYDGTNPTKPIYVAIKGRVFNVRTDKSFNGLGESYAMFAGRAAGRAAGRTLANTSKNEEDISPSLQGLTHKEIQTLNDWKKKFEAEYLVVGTVSY